MNEIISQRIALLDQCLVAHGFTRIGSWRRNSEARWKLKGRATGYGQNYVLDGSTLTMIVRLARNNGRANSIAFIWNSIDEVWEMSMS